MVYAHTVNRITLRGTMFGGAEEWSTGFFLGQEGADAAVLSQAGLDQIKDAWAAFFTNATSWISNKYQFLEAKSALIDATGHTILSSVKYSSAPANCFGAAGTNWLPPQCSVVVTLLSDRPRGKASKGRMYLPGYSGGIGADGKIGGANAGAIATNMKTFFDSFAADADVPDQLILAAKGTGLTPALNAQNDFVETIRVGDVVDTQRRRRNGLVEAYQSRTLL